MFELIRVDIQNQIWITSPFYISTLILFFGSFGCRNSDKYKTSPNPTLRLNYLHWNIKPTLSGRFEALCSPPQLGQNQFAVAMPSCDIFCAKYYGINFRVFQLLWSKILQTTAKFFKKAFEFWKRLNIFYDSIVLPSLPVFIRSIIILLTDALTCNKPLFNIIAWKKQKDQTNSVYNLKDL